MTELRLFSWNVNGLRSVMKKGLLTFLELHRPDVLCLQEIRASASQIDLEPLLALGYSLDFHPAERPGYSGVATFSREPPQRVVLGMGEPRFDTEGRVLITEHRGLTVFNVYFPNAGRDLSRLDYKTDFYRSLKRVVDARRDAGEAVIICGDWNTAHQNVDIENWRGNLKASGFTPHERAVLDEYLEQGYVDAFRALHPETKGAYSWWSNRPGVREKNVGWRIDYHAVDVATMPSVRAARLHPEVRGSDHCPVELVIEPKPSQVSRS